MGQHVTVAIIGSGFSGLCMAIKLKEAGIHDFVLLERAGNVGGTWRDNTYPGCACDVPSHLYSFSFETSGSWSRAFAQQPEIQEYLERCFDKYGVRDHVRLHSPVVGADWTGAGWRVLLQGDEVLTCDILVSAVGGLSNPAYPDFPGRERFQGTQFHSAEWNHDFDLTNKRVAVIGTGASTIQFLPEIQPKVAELVLFQRTPPWILPRADRPFRPAEIRAFERWPIWRKLYRQSIYWQYELRVLGFAVDPRIMKVVAYQGKRHIRRSIRNPELRKKVTPHFMPGCKRILMSNDYYQALDQPNVEVETDGIAEIKERSIVTRDGREIPVDAIIYGTGFKVHEYVGPMKIRGRDGLELSTAWRDGAQAYLGTTVAGFPNLFMVIGPNTGLGHNSIIYMIESQVHYIMQCIDKLRKEGAPSNMDVREPLQKSYNERLQSRLEKSVWNSGCASWYLDKNGKNTTIWPGFTFVFRARTRRFDPNDYQFGEPKTAADHHVAPEAQGKGSRANGLRAP